MSVWYSHSNRKSSIPAFVVTVLPYDVYGIWLRRSISVYRNFIRRAKQLLISNFGSRAQSRLVLRRLAIIGKHSPVADTIALICSLRQCNE